MNINERIEKLDLTTFKPFKNRKGLIAFNSGNGTSFYRLYNTNILVINEKYIQLNTDGFTTNHTKNCMNDNLPDGYSVYQKDFKWYVNTPEGIRDFEDNMIIRRF